MGLDHVALSFLKFASLKRPIGKVLTIGRQSTHVSSLLIRDILGIPSIEAQRLAESEYCEEILICGLNACSVTSIDISDYESPTYIHDFNRMLPKSLASLSFDTVIDIGSLEHIFDVPQALKNISQLCGNNAQIIHILPANNCMGHGFWQFSPELFFTYYSAQRGYKDTQIFLVEDKNSLRWYQWFEAHQPPPGSRLETTSSDCQSSIYMMVRTIKTRSANCDSIYQSDYVYHWSNAEGKAAKSHPKQTRRYSMVSKKIGILLFMLRIFALKCGIRFDSRKVWHEHPCLKSVDARKLLAQPWV